MSAVEELQAAFGLIKQAAADAAAKIKALLEQLNAANEDGEADTIESIAAEMKATAEKLEAVANPPAADPGVAAPAAGQ